MLLGFVPAEAKFFTCLDLEDAFFCIYLAPQSQPIFGKIPTLWKRGN
jgi:hypothetical protein